MITGGKTMVLMQVPGIRTILVGVASPVKTSPVGKPRLVLVSGPVRGTGIGTIIEAASPITDTSDRGSLTGTNIVIEADSASTDGRDPGSLTSAKMMLTSAMLVAVVMTVMPAGGPARAGAGPHRRPRPGCRRSGRGGQ